MLRPLLLFICVMVVRVSGHGRLVDPPSRASAWRYGFDTPRNYDDHGLNCGGFNNQWWRNGGKCGICGDPYQGPREHEAGGEYATGTITRRYRRGQVIDVTVQLTANHRGWFEFKLCPVNNRRLEASQACLDAHALQLVDGGGTRFPVRSSMYRTDLQLRLPNYLTCSQCVLQWRYHAGNNWGVDSRTGEGGLGFGPQEEFYGCADISIV